MNTSPTDPQTPRVHPTTFRSLSLRAHELLSDVPLHDVWQFRLVGGGPNVTMQDVINGFAALGPARRDKSARLLFAIRKTIGRLLGCDREDPDAINRSYVHRLSAHDRTRSVDAPGTTRGFWKTVYTFEDEAVGEVINRTVHAFLVFALKSSGNDHVLYWGVYVKRVNRFTPVYMAVIDPFRRYLIYPTLIRRFEKHWRENNATG